MTTTLYLFQESEESESLEELRRKVLHLERASTVPLTTTSALDKVRDAAASRAPNREVFTALEKLVEYALLEKHSELPTFRAVLARARECAPIRDIHEPVLALLGTETQKLIAKSFKTADPGVRTRGRPWTRSWTARGRMAASSPPRGRVEGTGPRCFLCQSAEHLVRNCPRANGTGSEGNEANE